MSAPHGTREERHDVVVLGGGNAGIALAARLLHQDSTLDVAVVEPSAEHRYRPLQNYVAVGRATQQEASRPQHSVMPAGARWVQAAVTALSPDTRQVSLGDGGTLRYKWLVLAVGSEPDWDAVPGAPAALESGWASTSFEWDGAPRVWERLGPRTEGTVVFTLPSRLTSCGPTGLKPLLMLCDHWRRQGVLGRLRVVLLAEGRPTGVTQLDPVVVEALHDYGVETYLGVREVRLDVDAHLVHACDDTGAVEVPADALHLVPTYRPAPWLLDSGLVDRDGSGLVDVDVLTLRHRHQPRIFALGDCAASDNVHSGAALRTQTKTVTHNLMAARRGAALVAGDGYSATPVTTSLERLTFAEVGRDGRRMPSLPGVDLFRPRRASWAFDRYVLPQLYWRRILRGR